MSLSIMIILTIDATGQCTTSNVSIFEVLGANTVC